MKRDKKIISTKSSASVSASLRIAAAQINTTVGDIDGNTQKIISIALRARDEVKADLVVFPEMTITGYPPEDLLLRPELYVRVNLALDKIKEAVKDIHVIVGHPTIDQKNHYNAASIIYNTKTIATYYKQQLPNYGVFDEKRYFIAGTEPCVCEIKNSKIALAICEDLWFPDAMAKAKKAKAQLMISINASPFDMNKPSLREEIMGERAREGKMPLLYLNCVGGQDELVFDGDSMLLNAAGQVMQRATLFAEGLMVSDFNLVNTATTGRTKITLQVAQPPETLPTDIGERAYKALVLGVRDYVNKNHFRGAIVSVSGGIDSALTLAIAVDALGKERVETVYMPSRYSSTLSEQIVNQQARTLGVKLATISIESVFQTFLNSLTREFVGRPADTTEENIQARCRGTLLMALSNKKGLIVLSTGNKSEMAVGYATLYGDMVGGFCVLKDVPKMLVYKLANYRNTIAPVIPQNVIDRPPSAELAANQKDSDSLPPYPILDAILEKYIEQEQSKEEIIAAGFDEQTVEKVIKLVNHNEYKRRQAPPGVRITAKAFGRDRRYPITSEF